MSLGRRLQDPLTEFTALANADNEEILALQMDALQSSLDPDDLKSALEIELVSTVNDAGVDVNFCLEHPHSVSMLTYVCGLGPRKATAFLKVQLLLSFQKVHVHVPPVFCTLAPCFSLFFVCLLFRPSSPAACTSLPVCFLLPFVPSGICCSSLICYTLSSLLCSPLSCWSIFFPYCPPLSPHMLPPPLTPAAPLHLLPPPLTPVAPLYLLPLTVALSSSIVDFLLLCCPLFPFLLLCQPPLSVPDLETEEFTAPESLPAGDSV